jgi:hypothetical protein
MNSIYEKTNFFFSLKTLLYFVKNKGKVEASFLFIITFFKVNFVKI